MSNSVKSLAQQQAAYNRVSVYNNVQGNNIDNNINIALAKYVVLFLNGEIDNFANYKSYFTIFSREVQSNMKKNKPTNLISMFDNYSIRYSFGGMIELTKNIYASNNGAGDFKIINMSDKNINNYTKAKKFFPKLSEKRWREISNLFGYCQNNFDTIKENHELKMDELLKKKVDEMGEAKLKFEQAIIEEEEKIYYLISKNKDFDMSRLHSLRKCLKERRFNLKLLEPKENDSGKSPANKADGVSTTNNTGVSPSSRSR